MDVDFPKPPSKNPTKKQKALHKRWVKYLSDSRLTQSEVYGRAKDFTLSCRKPPKE